MSIQTGAGASRESREKIADKDWIEGIDLRLEVMSAAPLGLSTPFDLLAKNRITDKSILFVRNIQDLPEGTTMDSLPLEGWEIELTGLIIPYRVLIHGEDLLEMEQVEYEMIFQRSGNGWKQYPGVPGTRWNQGGVGNVRFSGVPLRA
jgi:sulfite oxidase